MKKFGSPRLSGLNKNLPVYRCQQRRPIFVPILGEKWCLDFPHSWFGDSCPLLFVDLRCRLLLWKQKNKNKLSFEKRVDKKNAMNLEDEKVGNPLDFCTDLKTPFKMIWRKHDRPTRNEVGWGVGEFKKMQWYSTNAILCKILCTWKNSTLWIEK